MKPGRVKTTLVLVATKEQNARFRRLKEMPAALRRQLEKATQGPLAGYIVIADRKGRERLRKKGGAQ